MIFGIFSPTVDVDRQKSTPLILPYLFLNILIVYFIIFVTAATSSLRNPLLLPVVPIHMNLEFFCSVRLKHYSISDIYTQQFYWLYYYFAFECIYRSFLTTDFQIIYFMTFIRPCTLYKYYWNLSFSWVLSAWFIRHPTKRVHTVVSNWQGRTATPTTACQMFGASTTTKVAVKTNLRAPGYPPAWPQPRRGAVVTVGATSVRRSTGGTGQLSQRTNCTNWRELSRSRTTQTCTAVRSSPWRWTCPRCACR